jgi:hypothetical protein
MAIVKTIGNTENGSEPQCLLLGTSAKGKIGGFKASTDPLTVEGHQGGHQKLLTFREPRQPMAQHDIPTHQMVVRWVNPQANIVEQGGDLDQVALLWIEPIALGYQIKEYQAQVGHVTGMGRIDQVVIQ